VWWGEELKYTIDEKVIPRVNMEISVGFLPKPKNTTTI
jgi:hypothetical protein